MRWLVTGFFAGAVLQASANSGSDIRSDIALMRATDKSQTVNLDAIVSQYIHPGMGRAAVEHYLSTNDFKLYPVAASQPGGAAFVAVRKDRGLMAFFGFFDEVRIVVDVEKDAVVKATGTLFSHSL